MYDFKKQRVVEPPRQFLGVWIPKEILLNENLKAVDKILYAEIASFGDKGCWKKSDELQKICGIKCDGLRAAASRLKKEGFIFECRKFGRIVRYSTNGFSQRTENPSVLKTENPSVLAPENPSVLKEYTKEYTKDIANEFADRRMDEKKDDEDDEVRRLFYQVIAALNLPVMNHNVLRKKIKEMEKLYPKHITVQYLTFMKDSYKSWDARYKPQVNTALEIYSKSRQIMTRLHEDSKAQEVF